MGRVGLKKGCDGLLTKEGACGEDGDDEGLAGGVDVVGAVGVVVAKGAEPVVHLDDAGDGACVVAVEDTAKGGEGGHGDACSLALGGVGADARAGSERRHGEGEVVCGRARGGACSARRRGGRGEAWWDGACFIGL